MKRLLSIFLMSFFIFLLTPIISSPANAVTCSTSSYISPDHSLPIGLSPLSSAISPFTFLTLDEFLDLNHVNIPSSCYGVGVQFYTAFMNKVRATATASSTNAFSTRLNSCMKGQSVSLWSPSSYLNWTRCTLIVGFVPSSSILVQQFTNVKVAISTHVPLAYLGVVVSFISTVSTNWGTSDCVASNLSFTMSIPHSPLPLNVAIPCKPPVAIQSLRYLMVVGVWFMVVLFIYRETLRFMDGLTS